jgi:hypothetical protein
MEASPRIPSVALPLLVALAVIGYLAGSHRPQSSSLQGQTGAGEVSSTPDLTIEHPRGWVRSGDGPLIPGLSAAGQLRLTPRGAEPGAVGLLSGTLDRGDTSLLPAALRGRLSRIPQTEVVNLDAMQAFRFRGLTLAGLNSSLDLYVLPTSGSGATALACYAPTPASGQLRECEQIVATLTLVGQAAEDLTPDPTYRQGLAGVLAGLRARRARGAETLAGNPARTAFAAVVEAAAARYGAGAKALAALEPPPVAAAAQSALTEAIHHAGLADRGLAEAVDSNSAAGYSRARVRLLDAEGALQASLGSFALLGYGRS